MLGLPKGEVFLIPWTATWLNEFSLEKDRIKEIIVDDAIEVYHIGSTAVKGLSAKPILDIAIEINKFDDGEEISKKLEKIGYVYGGSKILPERHYLIKGEPRTHQIHKYADEKTVFIKSILENI